MAIAEEKKALLLNLLGAGVAKVHIDARRPGVRVPPQFRNEGHLRLNVGYKFEGIGLLVDWYRIGATLHFPGSGNYRCILPWDAIFGLTPKDPANQGGAVWVEDMPPDVARELAEKPKAVPHLKLVH